jgi:hypothetical protein
MVVVCVGDRRLVIGFGEWRSAVDCFEELLGSPENRQDGSGHVVSSITHLPATQPSRAIDKLYPSYPYQMFLCSSTQDNVRLKTTSYAEEAST